MQRHGLIKFALLPLAVPPVEELELEWVGPATLWSSFIGLDVRTGGRDPNFILPLLTWVG